jgi:hypothetical protein
MRSLPNGVTECDNELRNMVNNICNSSDDENKNLDVCHDEKAGSDGKRR